jgi:hypothetical protein
MVHIRKKVFRAGQDPQRVVVPVIMIIIIIIIIIIHIYIYIHTHTYIHAYGRLKAVCKSRTDMYLGKFPMVQKTLFCRRCNFKR